MSNITKTMMNKAYPYLIKCAKPYCRSKVNTDTIKIGSVVTRLLKKGWKMRYDASQGKFIRYCPSHKGKLND